MDSKFVSLSSFTCADGTIIPFEIYENEFHYEYHILKTVYNEELGKSEVKVFNKIFETKPSFIFNTAFVFNDRIFKFNNNDEGDKQFETILELINMEWKLLKYDV